MKMEPESIMVACRARQASTTDEPSAPSAPSEPKRVPKRVPVDFIYEALNPTFLKWMAKIGTYAGEKYGSWHQYKDARLAGDKSPINHIYEHLRQFVMGEPYDHFDGDVRWHLVAIAYNAMMSFYYVTKFGFVPHPLTVDVEAPGIPKREERSQEAHRDVAK
jgi:hypothetical protein